MVEAARRRFKLNIRPEKMGDPRSPHRFNDIKKASGSEEWFSQTPRAAMKFSFVDPKSGGRHAMSR
ncbi:hypothetical protein [Nocardia wallacei]|uniref:hypothetical protein n=1 Tax=Nocardia TaxID=1817 RepID=UPI0024576659|nr:hypothetical protein [Nocardia wallacei]